MQWYISTWWIVSIWSKERYDAFKNRKKDSDTSATTGIDISKDIKARNKPMPVSPRQRKENQKAIKEIVDSQEVKFIEEPKKPKRKMKNPYRYDSKSNEGKKIKPIVEKKKNQDNSSNNNQVTKKPTVEDDSLKIEESKKEVKKNQTTTTKGKTRSSNRSRILRNDANFLELVKILNNLKRKNLKCIQNIQEMYKLDLKRLIKRLPNL